MKISTFPMTLVESYMITPKVKHFVFKCEATPAVSYLAGQFISIHFQHGDKTLKRSYSIANPPANDNMIEFAASYFKDGPGTEYLFNLQVGDTVTTSGPFGRLTLKDINPRPTRYIFIATSTGITPYRAMLNELASRLKEDPQLSIVILQGVQRKEEILYAKEFQDFANKHSQVTFCPCLSREQAENLQDNEFSGYVQHLLPQLNLHQEQDMIYLCGNPGMIDDSFNYLKEQGFAIQQIVREKYISR